MMQAGIEFQRIVMASQSTPDDRAFAFDPTIVATSRPPPRPGEAPETSAALPWRDFAGLLTAVVAVPALAMAVMFAAVTTYGPLYLAEHPVRIAVAPVDVETTGSVGWALRDTLDE